VSCRILHVAQVDTGVQGEGDERVPQVVRMDAPSLRWYSDDSKPSEEPPYGCLVEPTPGRSGEEWTVLSAQEVMVQGLRRAWRERHRRPLPTFPA